MGVILENAVDDLVAVGAMIAVNQVGPAAVLEAVDDDIAAVGAERVFTAAARHIADIDIPQPGRHADVTGRLQGFHRGIGSIGHAVGRMKATDMPGGVRTQFVCQEVRDGVVIPPANR
jgi:hypothetical protein